MAELIIEEPRHAGNRIEVAARFTSSSGTYRLWYRIEAEHQRALAVNADPFVLGTVHLAMQTGEDVLIDGEVSPSLLANLELFQQAWSTWRPERYRQVDLRATIEKEPNLPVRNAAISGFTGGVDSCFTAYRHTRGVTTRFPLPLRATVMVHGFDIPLDDEEGYSRASAKAQRQVMNLGLEFFRVETNYRELPVHWPYTFGSAVASVLALFQGRFNTGLIAAGIPFGAYRSLVEGSNPITDPMLSSAAFGIVGDGAGFQRIEKIAVLAQWPEGVADLRVCSRNPVRYENCCECEKCIRNILSFRALGLGRPVCFSRDVSDEQIMRLVPIKEIMIDVGYDSIVRIATNNGLGDDRWVRTVRRAIRLSHLRRKLAGVRGGRWVWKLVRKFGSAG